MNQTIGKMLPAPPAPPPPPLTWDANNGFGSKMINNRHLSLDPHESMTAAAEWTEREHLHNLVNKLTIENIDLKSQRTAKEKLVDSLEKQASRRRRLVVVVDLVLLSYGVGRLVPRVRARVRAWCACVRAFVRVCVRAGVCACVHPCVRASVRPIIHPFIRSFVHSFIRSFVHSFIRSFVHPFIRSSVHPFIRSSVHSSICLSVSLSLHFSISPSIRLSVSPSLLLSDVPSHCEFIFHSLRLCIPPSILSPSLCPSPLFLSVLPSLCLSVSLSPRLPVSSSLYLTISFDHDLLRSPFQMLHCHFLYPPTLMLESFHNSYHIRLLVGSSSTHPSSALQICEQIFCKVIVSSYNSHTRRFACFRMKYSFV